MEVASLDYDSNLGYGHAGKLRSRALVKPILKKLNSRSNSDKDSIDLDRAWDDQVSPLGFPTLDYMDTYPRNQSPTRSYSPSGAGDTLRSGRDVSFSFSSTSDYAGPLSRAKYSHIRSTSGTSHASIATSTSGRNGSFVHPFQQTPRTATPPLSYANSIASLDNAGAVTREYPPLRSKDDDALDLQTHHFAPASNAPHYSSPPLSNANSSFGRSTFTSSHRSSSLSEGTQTPREAPSTSRCNSGPVQRLNQNGAQATISRTQTDPQLTSTSFAADSSLSSTAPPSNPSPLMVTSTSYSPISTLRNSLDLSGFRIRSRSDVDATTQQEQVREARRKFEAREKAKEEKYARQQSRRKERTDTKEGHKGSSRLHKGNAPKPRLSHDSSSLSSSGELDVAGSRKRHRHSAVQEKVEVVGQDYESVAAGQTPVRADDVHFETPKRRRSAKHKTTGAWTSFMLWLRTRLLKIGRR